MFDLNNAKDKLLYITKDDILNKISEYDIWRYYCKNFEEIDKPFLSELYNDRNPACRIKHNSLNRLIYKDFGEPSHVFDCFSYIQFKYSCTLPEALRIIYNDFKLGSIKIDIIPQLVLNSPLEGLKRAKSNIEVIPQPYTIHDKEYWGQYCISLEMLYEEEIISCKLVYLHTSDGKTITYESNKNNLIYAYKEYDIDLNFIGYKVYLPLAKKGYKWLNNSSNKAIQGIKSIKRSGKVLGITKARKDCLCYKLLGYEAIAPYNENGDLDINRIIELIPLYGLVFINFDPDDQGMRATDVIQQKYGLKGFYIDQHKDLSDYIMNKGLLSAKRMINKKIKEL